MDNWQWIIDNYNILLSISKLSIIHSKIIHSKTINFKMILIADSGSTKTDWRIIEDNQVVGQTQTVGFNPYFQDADSIANELKTSLLPHCEGKVEQVFYYGTGITNDEKAEVLKTALQTVFPDCIVEAHSDVVGAARALCVGMRRVSLVSWELAQIPVILMAKRLRLRLMLWVFG
jgi:hypothetical protein